MKKSTKATLLSVFIFPGAGHLYLRRYLPGFLLASATLTGLYFLITQIVQRALYIVDIIQRGEIQLDINAIADLVSRQTSGADARQLNIAAAVVFICWIVGIVDSYRVGRVQEKTLSSDLVPKK